MYHQEWLACLLIYKPEATKSYLAALWGMTSMHLLRILKGSGLVKSGQLSPDIHSDPNKGSYFTGEKIQALRLGPLIQSHPARK